MKVFVSSTSADLVDYRAAAIQGLRRLGHEVVAMEDFTAAASYPLSRVLELVRECDALVILLAWRYGFRPEPVNTDGLPQGGTPKKTSITEYEFLAAKEKEIPILAFLLREDAPWSPQHIDGFAGKGSTDEILRFRAQLMNEYVVGFFSTPAEVESGVTAAIANTRIKSKVKDNSLELGEPVQGWDAVPDSSYSGALTHVATNSRGMSVVTIDIATAWWSTRLYLLAFLLQSLTEVKRILIKEGSDFIGLVSIETTIKTMLPYHTELQRFDRKMRRRSAQESDVDKEADAIVAAFEQEFSKTPEPEFEKSVKLDLTDANLKRWFGDAIITSAIQIEDLSSVGALDLVRLLDYPGDFVPVVSTTTENSTTTSQNVHVIDTLALSKELARSYVQDLLDSLVRR